MQRTKTIDVVTVKSSTGYVEPCNKVNIIVETIFKDNFVRTGNKNSILYEEDPMLFKQFMLNTFGKIHISQEALANVCLLLDRIVSTTNFVLKPQNANRLLIGLILIVFKLQKLNKFFDKLLNLSKDILESIEKEVSHFLNHDFSINKELQTEYINEIYQK